MLTLCTQTLGCSFLAAYPELRTRKHTVHLEQQGMAVGLRRKEPGQGENEDDTKVPSTGVSELHAAGVAHT